jgi:hypothetical protein
MKETKKKVIVVGRNTIYKKGEAYGGSKLKEDFHLLTLFVLDEEYRDKQVNMFMKSYVVKEATWEMIDDKDNYLHSSLKHWEVVEWILPTREIQ